jgi:hypothetical protein
MSILITGVNKGIGLAIGKAFGCRRREASETSFSLTCLIPRVCGVQGHMCLGATREHARTKARLRGRWSRKDLQACPMSTALGKNPLVVQSLRARQLLNPRFERIGNPRQEALRREQSWRN